MRKFYLYNKTKSISFDLNTLSALATEPSGLGNKFKVGYTETDTGKHAVNVKPEFEPIKLKIYFNADGSNGYANYKSLLTFLTTCGKNGLIFEYIDDTTDRFCEVILQLTAKSEINEEGVFAEDFVFERQNYWYEQITTLFELSTNDENPSFPLSFPLSFTGLSFNNTTQIKNSFFEPAPLTVKISGEIEKNISVYIATTNEEIISEVQLSCGNVEGRTIVIDAKSKKIKLIDNSGNETNGYSLTNKAKQSFLYVPQGEYIIGSNIQSTDTGKIEISIERYLLD